MFIGRIDGEAEAPILWPPDVKSWLIGKDPDAGKGWRQEEKGTTEDEMVGWHHWLDRHEFEWTPGVGDGQGGLICCNPWGGKVRHYRMTELNWSWLLSFAKLIFCVWQDILNEGSSALIHWPSLLHLGHVCLATAAGPSAQTPTLNLNSRPHCLALVIPLDLWTMSNYYKSL